MGRLDSIRDSKILFNINPEILHSSNICADSTALLSSTLRLRSVNDVYTPIGELNDGEYNSSLEGDLKILLHNLARITHQI